MKIGFTTGNHLIKLYMSRNDTKELYIYKHGFGSQNDSDIMLNMIIFVCYNTHDIILDSVGNI